MAITTFGLTYSDIEAALQGWDLSDKSAQVAAVINRVAASWNGLLRKIGITPAEIATTDLLYTMSQDYLILRASAEVGRRFTRQDPELSRQRDKEAQRLWDELASAPEAYYEAWDTNKQLGSYRANVSLTPRSPGASSVGRPGKMEVF